jgi:SAM-dependent methyltransferase
VADATAHWEGVYAATPATGLSWYQAEASTSLRLIELVAPTRTPVLDVGAGSSSLAGALLARGWRDVTALDVSANALEQVRVRWGADPRLHLVVADLRAWRPVRPYGVWHDRAVLHFLTEPADAARYAELVAEAVLPGGGVVIGVFGPEGPTHCSGLEVRRYRAEEVGELLGRSFEVVRTETEEHRTPRGTAQSFVWVALRRRARDAE